MSDGSLDGLPRVARLMARLCEIPSPSRSEQQVAAFVRGELSALGMKVTEDDAGQTIPAGCGNITARLAATAPGTPIMFCAHLDTVPVNGPIEVVLTEDGDLTNRHDTILGGDNKSAVATMLQAVRQVVDQGLPHAGIELVFTPCEEISLRGAHAYDPSQLVAEYGFIYDHTGPVGGIVTSAPWHKRITATFVGLPAHAGLCPENGRSAILAASAAVTRMPLGRIDERTTANVGIIRGGEATNVVPAECELVAEARSRDEQALSDQITAMLDALAWAGTEHECDVEIRVENQYLGYRLTSVDPAVAHAERAIRRAGLEPQHVASGGGSDVNALLPKGFPCVNLCNDMVDVHTAQERISVAALESMLEVTMAIIAEAVEA
ncbi:MAG: M20/M25/M40 family metallo-hydrolase [Thermoleophilia bacterium]